MMTAEIEYSTLPDLTKYLLHMPPTPNTSSQVFDKSLIPYSYVDRELL